MNSNSWMRLAEQDPRHQLPAALRAQDPRGAADCGWVEQMTPFISHYARPGEWVIDPFCGFGSTLVAASIAGMPALGVELDAQRVALTQARLDALGLDPQAYQVWQGNLASAQTQARCKGELGPVHGAGSTPIGLCLTNIPYFGAGAHEGADADQLYQARRYEPYLQTLREVFNGVHAVLAPGAWCIVMAQNLRLGTSFVPLAWDVAKLLDERFVLHEERLLIYDREADASRLGAGGVSATNRAHEYALVCRKQSRGVDVEAGLALLGALELDGFELLLYGSFADHLDRVAAQWGHASAHESEGPNDIDIICPPDDAELSRLLRRLEHEGFRIESWNAQVRAPVSVAALAYRYYFRARRVDQFGNRLQLDIAVAESRAAFEAQRTKRCSTTSLPHWLPGCSSASTKPAFS
jgi:hypothetical protein